MKIRICQILGCMAMLVLLASGRLQANAITLSNFSYNQGAQTVTYNIQWQNSWRLDSTALPFNWDAAWVFVKFRPCGAPASVAWTHGKVDPGAANSFGSLQPVAFGGAQYFPDSAGVMLRRQTNGLFGNAAVTTVTMRIANLPTTGQFDIKVFGIEMVFVPQGNYALGSVTNSNAFAATTVGSDLTPITISTENAVTVFAHNLGGVNGTVALPAAYPKGNAAFYVMKYEISEQQYGGFMNTITSIAQGARYPGNLGNSRNELSATGTYPNIYQSTRPDRAQNYLGWDDVMAYLDWAALRPISELEYEKVCRGLNPVVTDEYAWGSTNIVQLTSVSTPENGTEVSLITTANAHYNFAFLTGGDGGNGPVRVGIFALPTSTTRDGAGAAYYGVMEMSGNLWEPCVAVRNETSNAGAVAFTRNPGDGYLTATGAANVAGWPNVVAATQGWIRRGGAWGTSNTSLRTSDRSAFTWNGTRDDQMGGRGGR
jgi:formylglycine-generating enzyme required for sulfatase activity